jgi:hypothetical protein
MWRRHDRARAEPEEGDDKWGPPISRARRGVKAAGGEAFPREGGGNRAGRHRRTADWAERPRPSGERGSGWLEEKNGHGWAKRPDGPTGHWADWGESEGKILFRIKI